MKAVIIDDEKAAALDLARRLEAYPDINVVGTAQGGVEGLEMLAKHNPDVLFLDIEMPEVNGMEAAEKIREMDEDVVIYSAIFWFLLWDGSREIEYLCRFLSMGDYTSCDERI